MGSLEDLREQLPSGFVEELFKSWVQLTNGDSEDYYLGEKHHGKGVYSVCCIL